MKLDKGITLQQGARRAALAVVIALAGTAGVTAWAQPPMPHDGPDHGGWHERHGGPGRPGEHGPMMGGRPLQRLLDDADATTAQRGKIKAIFKAAHDDLKAQHEADAGLHKRAMAIFTQPTVDAAAAEGARQQMQAERDKESKRMLQAMLDAANVLTPDQRVKLGELMKQREAKRQQHEQQWQQRHQQPPAPAASKP